jgi:Na+/H+-translocating membrane pyrophosphatase
MLIIHSVCAAIMRALAPATCVQSDIFLSRRTRALYGTAMAGVLMMALVMSVAVVAAAVFSLHALNRRVLN